MKEQGKEKMFEDEIPYYNENKELCVKTVRRPHIIVKDINDPQAGTIWDRVRKIEYSIVGYDRLLNDVMKLAVAK